MNLADLRNDKYRGGAPKLPMCQMLLTKGKAKDTGFETSTPVLFIKSEALKLSGWINNGNGKQYIHTYNGGNLETGVAFSEPRINFLAASPRLVEVTDNGANAGIGIKGEIIDNYELPQGKEKHVKGQTTLRTVYMLYLVGLDNAPLHKIPLMLSIHGSAATYLGKALDMFYRQLEVAYSEHQNAELSLFGSEEQFFTLSQEARSLAIFQPQLDVVSAGEEQKSDIPAVVGYIEPTIENVESLFNFQYADKFQSIQKSFTNFAERYLKQFKQYHPVNNMTELALVEAKPEVQQASPSFNVSRLSTSVIADDIPDF